MFYAVPAATIEMTGTTVFPGGSPNTLGHLVPIGRLKGFSHEFLRFGNRVSGAGWEFLVRPGLLVTDETVHVTLRGKIEAGVFPTITRMTGGATSLVALDVHSKIVESDPGLTHFPLRVCRAQPRPVDHLVELAGRVVVT